MPDQSPPLQPTPAPGPATSPTPLPEPHHRQVDVNVHQTPHHIDPQSMDPWWLKVVGSATAVGLICILFTWLLVRVVNDRDQDVRDYERLQERADVMLEKHDGRMRDWMKSRDDRLGLEIEKLKLEVKVTQEQLKTAVELIRAIHERGTKQP